MFCKAVIAKVLFLTRVKSVIVTLDRHAQSDHSGKHAALYTLGSQIDILSVKLPYSSASALYSIEKFNELNDFKL